MKSYFKGSLFLLVWICGWSCQRPAKDYQAAAANPEFFRQSVNKLTAVIVHDIFSPPVASRIYAYPHIAAYEILIHDYPQYQSLKGQLNGFEGIPQPAKDSVYCFPLASQQAFLAVGRNLTFSGDMLDKYEEQLYAKYLEMGVPREVYDRSLRYGQTVAKAIMAYANEDGYSEEAEWCFGLSWLAIIYAQRGEKEKALHYLHKARATVTAGGLVPELYYSHTQKPNDNTPLGWAESMYVIALKKVGEMQ